MPPRSSASTSTSADSPVVPISPFSLSSDGEGASTSSSHYTSDDQPDLGAFGTVFREWGYLQPALRIPYHGYGSGLAHFYHPTTMTTTSMSVTDGTGSWTSTGLEDTDTTTTTTTTSGMTRGSPGGRRSTVWNQQPIADYLGSESAVTNNTTTSTATKSTTMASFSEVSRASLRHSARMESSGASTTDTDDGTEGGQSVVIEHEMDGEEVEVEDEDEDEDTGLSSLSNPASSDAYVDLDIEVEMDELDVLGEEEGGEEPSLGYLDQALSFIAAERAKLDAQRAAGVANSVKSGWKRVIEPRRKRQRKKIKASSTATITETATVPLVALFKSVSEGEDEDDGLSLSSKPRSTCRTKPKSKSTPGTPHPRSSGRLHVLGVDGAAISGKMRATSSTLPTSPAALSRNTTATSDSEPKASRRLVKKKKKQQDQLVSPPTRILARVKSAPSSPRNRDNETEEEEEEEEEEELKTPTQRDINAGRNVRGGDTHGSKMGRLQELAKELQRTFPAEQDLLVDVEAGLGASRVEEADPRGRPPREGDPLVHVFIDHSNILIGLLMHLKRHPTSSTLSSEPPAGSLKSPGSAKAILDVKTREREGAGHGPPPLKPRPETSRLLSQGEKSLSTVASSPSFDQDLTPSEESTGPMVSSSHPPSSSSSSDSQMQRYRLAFVKLPIPLPSFSTAARLMTYVDARSERGSDGEAGTAAAATAVLNAGPPKKTMEVQPGPPHGSASGAVPIPIPIRGSMERSTSDDLLVFEGPFGRGKGEGGGGGSVPRDGHSWAKGSGGKDHDDGNGDGGEEDGEGEESDNGRHKLQQEVALQRKKQWTRPGAKRTMWHTALTLILERGRPITRRVCVTSSPLYQPMDAMERFGYEVRIYMRVPDLGDGMDRSQRQKHRRTGSCVAEADAAVAYPARGSKKKMRERQVSAHTLSADSSAARGLIITSPGTSSSEGGAVKGSIRSSAATMDGASSLLMTSFSATPATVNPMPVPSSAPASIGYGTSSQEEHRRQIYHNQRLHPEAGGHHQAQHTYQRIRYREQGVDELLQLKLHQAIAATDVVPEGATIVLATGDGNVGEFSDDGFLGPVRTALRRGWKVELYAWEDGLSRAWRKEFGVGSEWERSGMFRIIGMEQFAAYLVDQNGELPTLG